MMKTSLDWEARPAGQQEWEGNNMMQDWEGDRIAMHCAASDLQTISHDRKIGRVRTNQRSAHGANPERLKATGRGGR